MTNFEKRKAIVRDLSLVFDGSSAGPPPDSIRTPYGSNDFSGYSKYWQESEFGDNDSIDRAKRNEIEEEMAQQLDQVDMYDSFGMTHCIR